MAAPQQLTTSPEPDSDEERRLKVVPASPRRIRRSSFVLGWISVWVATTVCCLVVGMPHAERRRDDGCPQAVTHWSDGSFFNDGTCWKDSIGE